MTRGPATWGRRPSGPRFGSGHDVVGLDRLPVPAPRITASVTDRAVVRAAVGDAFAVGHTAAGRARVGANGDDPLSTWPYTTR